MKVQLLDDPVRWDTWVTKEPGGNILQSYAWGQLKAGFGWQPLRVALEQGGDIVAGAQLLLRPFPLGAMAYVPKGPLVDFSRSEEVAKLFSSLHGLARERGATHLKIEPDLCNSAPLGALLKSYGFRKGSEVQPRSTILLDLRPGPETLLAGLRRGTRYNIQLAMRKGVTVTRGDEAALVDFYRLLQETGRRGCFLIHSLAYYQQMWRWLATRDMAELLLARWQGELLAGAIILTLGRRAYYMYGASSSRHRHLKPNELLQWEAILWAKGRGCTSYDFWGIPDEVGRRCEDSGDERPPAMGETTEPSYWGVYQFKRGFGGRVVRHLGAYDYVYSPARYWLQAMALPRLRRWRAGWQDRSASERLAGGELP